MKPETAHKKREYGIGAVARLTGLTDHTIRVWERRYAAVVTERAANGRRVYTEADVEKLGLLKSLTDNGFSIGQIASQDIGQLRAQARSLGTVASATLPETVRIAVLGDFLPAELHAAGAIEPFQVVVADSNRDRFEADIKCQAVDAIVFENAVLDADTVARLREYLSVGSAAHGVLVYGFGRSRDVKLARDSNIVVLRSPANTDEIRAALVQAFAQPMRGPGKAVTGPASTPPPDWQFTGTIAPRRFDQQQLSRLANTASALECECPQHLAQLVGDLSAFEIYSANCANRNEEDAALHRYLHQTTAQARALIEGALQKVAESEGLSV